MRENRPYGSEGGGAELNRLSPPLSVGKMHRATLLRAAGAEATHARRMVAR